MFREFMNLSDAVGASEICESLVFEDAWIWYCDECRQHGTAFSPKEAEYVGRAHAEFHTSVRVTDWTDKELLERLLPDVTPAEIEKLDEADEDIRIVSLSDIERDWHWVALDDDDVSIFEHCSVYVVETSTKRAWDLAQWGGSLIPWEEELAPKKGGKLPLDDRHPEELATAQETARQMRIP